MTQRVSKFIKQATAFLIKNSYRGQDPNRDASKEAVMLGKVFIPEWTGSNGQKGVFARLRMFVGTTKGGDPYTSLSIEEDTQPVHSQYNIQSGNQQPNTQVAQQQQQAAPPVQQAPQQQAMPWETNTNNNGRYQ